MWTEEERRALKLSLLRQLERDGDQATIANTEAMAGEIIALRARLAEVEAETTCETHNHALVWCNECCRIDREAWQARLAEVTRERDAAMKEGHRLSDVATFQLARVQALAAALEATMEFCVLQEHAEIVKAALDAARGEGA